MTNYFNQYIISNPRLLFYPFLRSRIINLKFSSIFCLQLVRQFDTLVIFSPLITKSEFVTRAKLSHVYPDSYGWRRTHGLCVRACMCVCCSANVKDSHSEAYPNSVPVCTHRSAILRYVFQ